MTVDIQIALTGLLALAAGLLIAWLVMRRRVFKAYQDGEAAADPEIRRLTGVLESHENDARQCRQALGDLEKRLAVAEHMNAAIPGLKSDLAVRRSRTGFPAGTQADQQPPCPGKRACRRCGDPQREAVPAGCGDRRAQGTADRAGSGNQRAENPHHRRAQAGR